MNAIGALRLAVDNRLNQYCYYPNKPTDIDLTALREELKTDTELGLTEVETDRITFHIVSKSDDWLTRDDICEALWLRHITGKDKS